VYCLGGERVAVGLATPGLLPRGVAVVDAPDTMAVGEGEKGEGLAGTDAVALGVAGGV
jgi:hypothetical protein